MNAPSPFPFLPLFYFCVLLYMHMESKKWRGLRMRLDSTCLKVLSVAKHLQVSLITHTISVHELSILCKVLFWISYTAHIPNIGTSISVWHKKIKGPCSLVKLLVVLTHALNNWIFYTPCRGHTFVSSVQILKFIQGYLQQSCANQLHHLLTNF